MFLDTKNFKKEIDVLPQLLNSKDALSAPEMQNIKQKLMVAIHEQPKRAAIGLSMREKLMRYLATVGIGLSLLGGSAFAAEGSQPGDAFYSFKRLEERVKLSLSFSAEAKANLHAEFARERLNESQKLSAQSQAELNANTNVPGTPKKLSPETVKMQAEAKQEAKAEVDTAVAKLQEVKEKLEAKGNAQAAAAVEANILKLQVDAKAQLIP